MVSELGTHAKVPIIGAVRRGSNCIFYTRAPPADYESAVGLLEELAYAVSPDKPSLT